MLLLLVTGYLFIGALIGLSIIKTIDELVEYGPENEADKDAIKLVLNITVRLKSIRKTRMLIFTSIVLFWLPGAILMLIDVVMGRCK